MYRLFLLILLFAVSMPVFASRTVVTQTPYYTPNAYYGGDFIPQSRFQRRNNSVFYDINDLERYAMNKNFTRDSDRTRLERLETLAFGAVQEGDIYIRYDNVRNAILSRPKQNYKTSVLQSLSNYFNGQMTGFTPSITSTTQSNFYPYSSGYEQKSYSGYTTPWSNAFRTSSYGIGSGSGVKILD